MPLTEHRSGPWSPKFSNEDKATLFAIAEKTLAWSVSFPRAPNFDFSRFTLTESIKSPMATFVTLRQQGNLRGCIGSLAPNSPAYRSVHDNTLAAACHDPRFPPVGDREIATIRITISILSPIIPLKKPEEFRLGEQGIIMEKDGYRAVFLPEVAIEQGWDAEMTFKALSQKAGLPSDAWQEGSEFMVFHSVVLSQSME